MFHRDAIAAGLHALSAHEARAASPAAPGSSAATSPTGCSPTASRSSSYDDFRTGRREFVAGALERRRASWSRATCSTTALLEAAVAGCDIGLPPAGQRRRAPRPRAPATRPRAEHDRDLQRARGDARRRRRRGSRSPRPARSTASPRSSRRPRTRRSRSRPRSMRASKLAGEGLIGAYADGFGFTGVIFRFVSILGERYTHGHVFDFYRALQARPDAAARARRRAPGASRTSTCRTASTAILTAVARARATSRARTSTTSAPTRLSTSTTRSR